MMESNGDQFQFCKAELHRSCFSTMTEMRESGEFCDVTIRVEEECFPAHRVVLASFSPYFRAMFSSDMAESKREEITMKNIDPAALKSLIHFAYTSELKTEASEVPSLLKTAAYLQVDSVSEACLEFLWERINPENALLVRACAEFSSDVRMSEKTDRYVRENFQDVSESEDFLDLSYLTLKDFICSDYLDVVCEEKVFESVIKWVKASEGERSAHLPDLLRHVRMHLLTSEYLARHVSTEELVRTSSVCRNMVEEAKNYHHCPEEVKIGSRVFSTQERYCARSHHLKCSNVAGYGMYAIGYANHKLSVGYYDSINKRWASLCLQHQSCVPNYVACTKEKMYFVRSFDFQTLHLKTLEYTSTKIKGSSLFQTGVVLRRNKIYAFGGSSSNMVRCLHLENGICERVGETKRYRIRPSTACVADDIYVTGGYVLNPDFEMLQSAERYNSITGQSTEISPMLVKRWRHGCIALNEKIFVYGGSTFEANHQSHSPSVTCEVYDPLTDQWNFISPMSSPKRNMSSFAVANRLYVVESGNEDSKDYQVQSYDTSSDEWRFEESLSTFGVCGYLRVSLTDSASEF